MAIYRLVCIWRRWLKWIIGLDNSPNCGVQMQSLRWLVDAARRAGVRRVVVNGSFVTDVIEPNDADCVLLVGSDYPIDVAAEQELEEGLPFLELQLVDEQGFAYFVERFFATDRDDINKGMIEIVL